MMAAMFAAAACLAHAGAACAFDLDDILRAEALRDPLQTTPAAVRDGVVLPGDEASVSCGGAGTGEAAAELSLEAAVELALCSNPQVRAAWAAIKVQAGAVGEAKAAYLPTLTGSLSRLNDTTWFPGSTTAAAHTTGNTVYAALTWRLLDFGGREANLSAAKSLLAAALASHDATLQKTLTAVIQAYFDVQTTQAALVAKQEAASIASSTLQTARRKEARGAGSAGETLQAQTTVARATLEASRAAGDLGKAKAVMVYAIGAPFGKAFALAPLGPPKAGELAQSLADWLAQAEKGHPAIEAARAQVTAARARAEATRSEGLPSFDLSASFYQNGRPGQGLSTTQTRERLVGVTLNLPIFEGFARTYKIRGADALVEQRDAELHDVEHRVAMEVVQAYSDAAAALKNLDASDALLKAAQSSLASSQHKYEKGAADVLEILSTQKALADAQEERIRCLSEWRSASLRVVAAAGRLGTMHLKNTNAN
ncbi:TolC family protein [Variovorax sp. 2RAF20]|uniref:TolC family protein n=1 Tax=Variovorax sp. CF313 TaxID=1144315 RepID=UPI00138ACC76|nr:TolC family protein [Variovorax sp. CF313]